MRSTSRPKLGPLLALQTRLLRETRLLRDPWCSARRLARASLAALALAFVSMSAPPAHAAERLSLGEVSTDVTRREHDVPSLLRALAAEELRAVDAAKVPRGRPAVVSVSLVKMDSETNAKGSSSTCVVSIVLRDAKRGVLVALLQGRARAEDGARTATTAERAAMQASLRSALSRIPDALK